MWKCKNPDFEFHNKKIEKEKRNLENSLSTFLSAVGQHTFTYDPNPDFRCIPKDWRHRLPEKYHSATKALNSSADSTVEAYDAFIRKCKKELAL
jgi:hypothetical protein